MFSSIATKSLEVSNLDWVKNEFILDQKRFWTGSKHALQVGLGENNLALSKNIKYNK